MGNSSRKRRQASAERVSGQASAEDRMKAEQLRQEVGTRKAAYGVNLPEAMESAYGSAREFADTGGFRPEDISPVKEGYGDFAKTGGFTPEDKGNFLRRATAGVSSTFSRAKDALRRRSMVQGGYGAGADEAKLTRQGAQAGAEASLGANVELASQVRSGKMEGIKGLESVASRVQQGRLAGQDALQRYSQMGIAALSDLDMTELRNRLQSGQMSQADAQLLAMLASQDKTTFDKIMQGVGAVAGAAAGIGEAF